jgi:hypothetical protein
MARQIRNELSLKQGDKGKSASITRLFGVFRNAFMLQGTETATTIQRKIAGENLAKLKEKSNLEADKTVAETLLRKARALQ